MSGEFAGALRERVTLEQPPLGRDAMGGRQGNWRYDGAAWARVSPLMPAGAVVADALSALPRWSVTMRKREGVLPGSRLVWRGRFLIVMSGMSDPADPARMVLTCEEMR